MSFEVSVHRMQRNIQLESKLKKHGDISVNLSGKRKYTFFLFCRSSSAARFPLDPIYSANVCFLSPRVNIEKQDQRRSDSRIFEAFSQLILGGNFFNSNNFWTIFAKSREKQTKTGISAAHLPLQHEAKQTIYHWGSLEHYIIKQHHSNAALLCSSCSEFIRLTTRNVFASSLVLNCGQSSRSSLRDWSKQKTPENARQVCMHACMHAYMHRSLLKPTKIQLKTKGRSNTYKRQQQQEQQQ